MDQLVEKWAKIVLLRKFFLFNCSFEKNRNSIELNFCLKRDIIITSKKIKNRILNNAEKFPFLKVFCLFSRFDNHFVLAFRNTTFETTTS